MVQHRWWIIERGEKKACKKNCKWQKKSIKSSRQQQQWSSELRQDEKGAKPTWDKAIVVRRREMEWQKGGGERLERKRRRRAGEEIQENEHLYGVEEVSIRVKTCVLWSVKAHSTSGLEQEDQSKHASFLQAEAIFTVCVGGVHHFLYLRLVTG